MRINRTGDYIALYGAYIEGLKAPFATAEAAGIVEAAAKMERVIWACTEPADRVEIRRFDSE